MGCSLLKVNHGSIKWLKEFGKLEWAQTTFSSSPIGSNLLNVFTMSIGQMIQTSFILEKYEAEK